MSDDFKEFLFCIGCVALGTVGGALIALINLAAQ